jgi:5-methylcytosine-specific restriction endonuclease McrA
VDEALRRYFGKQLRRLFSRSPVKREALRTLPLVCVDCKKTHKKSDLELDHAEPVVPTDRPVGSLEYFLRMFCYDSYGEINLTNLVFRCVTCHLAKSTSEMGQRAANGQGPYSAEAKAKAAATRARRAKSKRKSRR